MKSNSWKLFLTLFLILISFLLITPLEDRSLGEYALSQVTSEANASDHIGHESFSEVIENLQNQIGEDEVIDYGKNPYEYF